MRSMPSSIEDLARITPPGPQRRSRSAPLAISVVAAVIVAGMLGVLWVVLSRGGGETPTATFMSEPGSALAYLKLDGAQPTSIIQAHDSVWVAARNGDQATLLRIDPIKARLIASIPLRSGPIWETGGGGMASGNGTVWVTGDGGLLQRIDAASNRLTRVIKLGANRAADVVVDGSGVWVSVFSTDEAMAVVRVDPSSGRIISTIPIAGAWIREVFSLDGFILVRSRIADRDTVTDTVLSVIDPSTNQVVSSARKSELDGPFAQSVDAVWGAARQELLRISISDGRAQFAEIPTADEIGDASLVPTGDSIWFVARGLVPVRVREVDIASGNTLRELALPITPVAMTVTQGSLWAFAYGSDSILIASVE
jgi:hypothetical protein